MHRKPLAEQGRIRRRIGLTFKFALVVMLVLFITVPMVIVVSVGLGWFEPGQRVGFPIASLGVIIACVILGAIVSFLVGDVPLKPIRKMIEAMDQLAKGEFDTRLEIAHPRELKEVANSFNQMAAELQGTEVLRSDFVNNFSHEFKTPIVSIKGFAEELLSEDISEEEQREYLQIIVRESDRLAKLSTDILELSKIESQSILTDVERFNLSEQIRRCVLMIEPLWDEKCLDVTIELEEIYYEGNEGLLSQVWLNLIDNAVKFTPRGGSLTVNMRQTEREIICIIADSGIGMDNQMIEHATERFYQGDASHSTKGNGIGLSLVKKVIALHEGTLTLSSNQGEGTEARVVLPIVS